MFILIPTLLPIFSSSLASELIVAFYGIINLAWLICIALSALFVARLFIERPKYESSSSILSSDVSNLSHIVAILIYKEPIDLIEKSLESLRAQTQASKLIVVIGLEEKTPQLEWKQQVIQHNFKDAFQQLIFTVHPYGLPNEIPGKCSNINYAVRTAVQRLKSENLLNYELTTVTSCDADNLFHPKYFEYLSQEFLSTQRRNQVVWQSPLFYNWQLASSPFFTRVTSILRPVFMMGILIPFNINTMSVFSLSLDLYVRGGYTHPGYQMEDIISAIRWMTEIKKRVEIKPLYIPTLSGPTSGHNILEEFHEWRRQARRWTIGAAEVFHYYCVRCGRIPMKTSVSWGLSFAAYYCIFLCTAPLVCSLGALMPVIYPETGAALIWGSYNFSEILKLMGLLQVACLSAVFILNSFWLKLLRLNEHVPTWRNFLHFLTSPFVVIAYAFIELLALHEMAIAGKSVCTHIPSKKEALSGRQLKKA
ncbi:MAG: hypothetical protein AAF821_15930 [Cyanobacteria bacterium P01_D01_bin.156]